MPRADIASVKSEFLIDVPPDIKLDGNVAFILSLRSQFNVNYSYKLKEEVIFFEGRHGAKSISVQFGRFRLSGSHY